MSWIWRLEDADGSPVTSPPGPTSPAHGSQSDAESWLGETWHQLAAEGVTQVTLAEDGRVVYGPMSLADP